MLSQLESVSSAAPKMRLLSFYSRKPKPFHRKVALQFKIGRFMVKTVANVEELNQVVTLRKKVFHYEFARKLFSFQNERDKFDEAGDLLAIYDLESQQLVGTYRLISSAYSDQFYSSTEYNVCNLLNLPGVKLELSRACIKKEFRTGAIIRLLWKGIAEYAKAINADYLFGMSSVLTTKVSEIATIFLALEQENRVDLSYNVQPRGDYEIKDFTKVLTLRENLQVVGEDLQSQIPSLMHSYFKAGAKVCSHPVIDQNFKCADFLTVLKMAELSPAYTRKFMS